VLEKSSTDNSGVTPKRPAPENSPQHNYDKSSGDAPEMEKLAPYPVRQSIDAAAVANHGHPKISG